MRSLRGFSLVELMVVVAIIGILASIAVPTFRSMQVRAKRAELPSCIDGIKTAQIGYATTYNEFVTTNEAPRASLSVDGVPVAWPGTADASWDPLGWEPDGLVRGAYYSVGTATDVEVCGMQDIDVDGVPEIWGASRSTNPQVLPSCG